MSNETIEQNSESTQNITPDNTTNSTPTTEVPVVKKIYGRGENGLLINKGYLFTQDGLVDYRKMLTSEHISPNKNTANGETDITKLSDSQLIILLSGLRYLAQLRGFTNVDYQVLESNPSYCCVKCTITWIPNYETDGRVVVTSSLADASKENTGDSFSSLYLAAIAENRAFARCVRQFLRISIVSDEELKQSNQTTTPENSSPTSSDPVTFIKNLIKDTQITFKSIKDKCISENKDGANEWKDFDDIPKAILFEFIERIKIAKEKAKEKAKS